MKCNQSAICPFPFPPDHRRVDWCAAPRGWSLCPQECAFLQPATSASFRRSVGTRLPVPAPGLAKSPVLCPTASCIFSPINREKYLVYSSSGIVLFVVFSFWLYPLWLFLVLNLITSHFCTTELNKLLIQPLSWIYPDHFEFICSVPLYLLYPPFPVLCHWQI